ncbi:MULTISPECIES: MFS transporter [Burkholderia]|uniref:Transmembrane transporter protein n=1 Tax=Burkholderia paludis TaxID=1506587 RepID=A0A6J5DBE6_9BURK|nr:MULTISPECIES: MFS transporter [Burkholderia]CAB3750096.1 Inner membrane transport protein YdhP [Burkholderia paludis]VWB13499.1 transmembrane transporter protein [Burkholderia paludis]
MAISTRIDQERTDANRFALLAMAMTSFGVGTTETIVTGLLPDIAGSLSVPLSSAGLLVSAYAWCVAIAAPTLTALTLRVPKKPLLLVLLAIFVLAHVVSALSGSYAVLLMSRCVAAAVHGVAMGIGVVVSAHLVDERRRAKAVGVMLSGITLANVAGVPLGLFLGHAFSDWHAPFWAIAGWGGLSLLALWKTLPNDVNLHVTSVASEVAVFRDGRMLLSYAAMIVGFGSTFVGFTYIAPILEGVAAFPPSSVTWVLLVFGAGLSAGNAAGARYADTWPLRTAFVSLACLACVMGSLGLVYATKWAVVAYVFLWGVASYAFVPALIMRILTRAGRAPNLASAMNVSAFNAGIGGGALVGSLVVKGGGAGVAATPAVGAAGAVLAIVLLALSVKAGADRAE